MLSTITTKGQVTIPKPLRDKFNLNPRDKVDFKTDGKQIILQPVKTLRDLRGSVPGSGNPEAERLAAKKAVGRRVVDEIE